MLEAYLRKTAFVIWLYNVTAVRRRGEVLSMCVRAHVPDGDVNSERAAISCELIVLLASAREKEACALRSRRWQLSKAHASTWPSATLPQSASDHGALAGIPRPLSGSFGRSSGGLPVHATRAATGRR